jgi:flagellar basal body-associated protein FliL
VIQQVALALSLVMAVYVMWPSVTWLWSKVPAIKLPSWRSSAAAAATDGPVTGAQALAAVDVLERFRANSQSDPSFKAVSASVKTLAEQMT